jgi:group I intron endonuclease
MYIYKVFLKINPDECYVGKTKNHIQVRLYQHYQDRRKERTTGLSYKMKEHSYDEFDIILLEECDDCGSAEREQHYINLYGTWNLTNAVAQPQNHKKRNRVRDNKQKIQHNQEEKVRYNKNRDKILAKALEPVMCECGIMSQRNHLARHKRTQIHKERSGLV